MFKGPFGLRDRERGSSLLYSPPLHLPPPSIQTGPKSFLDKLVSSMIVCHILSTFELLLEVPYVL